MKIPTKAIVGKQMFFHKASLQNIFQESSNDRSNYMNVEIDNPEKRISRRPTKSDSDSTSRS